MYLDELSIEILSKTSRQVLALSHHDVNQLVAKVHCLIGISLKILSNSFAKCIHFEYNPSW